MIFREQVRQGFVRYLAEGSGNPLLFIPLPLRVGSISILILAGCSCAEVKSPKPELIGPNAQAAYDLILLADQRDENELRAKLKGARYYWHISGSKRPEPRAAKPQDVPRSSAGPCVLDSLVERKKLVVEADWACDADTELHTTFFFGPGGNLSAIEQVVPEPLCNEDQDFTRHHIEPVIAGDCVFD